jgi:hypothetical protein
MTTRTNQTFTVVLSVGAKQLPTILECVAGSATLVSVTVSTEQVSPTASVERTKQQHYRDGKRNKGISGRDLVLKVLTEKGGLATFSQFAQAFHEHGFDKNSASPSLSAATKDKAVRMLGGGRYCLPGHTVKLGAGA